MSKKAVWNEIVLAESDDLVEVEGNQYFPLSSLNQSYFQKSDHRTRCPWKGEAAYYTVTVNGASNPNAAWYYPDPKPAAARIKGRVAFGGGIAVVDA